MTRIACLHTVASNVPVFDAALRDLALAGVELTHTVRADLLAAAEKSGGMTPAIAQQTGDALRALCADADAVLLTCSTVGPAAEEVAPTVSVPMLRVDAALAREAVRNGGKVVVLCAVETTVEPTRRLFEKAAQATGATIEMRLVPDAWDAFKGGDPDRYFSIIARAADAAGGDGVACVALAQASMAGAARLSSAGRPPLNSPAVGLKAAAEAAAAGR